MVVETPIVPPENCPPKDRLLVQMIAQDLKVELG
jgi:hypothetical protein